MQAIVFRLQLVSVLAFCALNLVWTSETQAQQTTKGRDFYVAFLPNWHGGINALDSVHVFIAAEQATTGTVSYSDGFFSINRNFTLNAGQVYDLAVSWLDGEMTGYNLGFGYASPNDNELVTSRSFHVQTNQDVSVYAMNQAVTTADAAVVYPVAALGTEYMVLSYKADGRTNNGQINTSYTPSEFCIVATQDNTVVTVIPSVPTSESGMAPKSVRLDKGETWLCQSDYSTVQLNYDLSGTRITSTAPIAVFSGHQRATVPVERIATAFSRDHLYEQMPPVNVWGMNYIITPVARPSGYAQIPGVQDLYRVLAANNGTEVRFNGVVVATLSRGQLYEAPLTSAGLLSASDRVLVAIIKQTHSDQVNNTRVGDPFMMIVPPRSQYLKKYTFVNTQVGGAYLEQYTTIITAANNTAKLRLDGSFFDANWQAIPNTCYAYAHVRMTPGAHTLESPLLVGLYVYGYGQALSYGYVGGMAFVPDLGNDEVTAGPDQNICIGDSVTIKMNGRIQTGSWTSATPGVSAPCSNCRQFSLAPLKDVRYVLTATDSLGCEIVDTVNVIVNELPDVMIRPDSILCTDNPTMLRAQGRFQSAIWTPSIGLSCTNCPNPIATPTKNMRYYVTVHNGSSPRCVATDSIDIIFRPGLANALPKYDTICRGDSAFFHVNYGGSLRWTPTTNINCAVCDSVWIHPPVTTTYTVTGDSSICTTQAQVTVVVVNPPNVQIPHDISVCKGQSAILNAVSNASSFTWSPPTFLSSTSSAQVQTTPDSDIVYTLRTRSAINSCESVDTVHVHVIPTPTIDVAPTDTSICSSDRIRLHLGVSGADSIAWTPSTGLSCTDCADPYVQLSSDQRYTVSAIIKGGCSVDRSFMVHVVPGPQLLLSTKTLKLCQGDIAHFDLQSNASVQWSPSVGLSCTDCLSPRFTASDTGRYVYMVRASTANGCTAFDSVVVHVMALPTDTVSLVPDTLCANSGPARVRVHAAKGGTRYRWENAPGLSCDTCAEPTLEPAQSTVYRVHITTSEGCVKTLDLPLSVVPCQRRLQLLSPGAEIGSACDAHRVYFSIQNVGDALMKVDTVYAETLNGLRAELDSAMNFPVNLSAGQLLSVPVLLSPNQVGQLSARMAVQSNASSSGLDTLSYTDLLLESQRYGLNLDVESNSTHPGDVIVVPISLRSNQWPQTHVHAVDFRLRYPSQSMTFMKSVSVISALASKGWTVSADDELSQNGVSSVVFHARGDSALNANGLFVYPRFQTFVSQASSFDVSIDSVWFPLEQICMQGSSTPATIELSGCAYNLRAVQGVSTSFVLHAIDPNPFVGDIIRLRYALSYDCHTDLRLVDALGRTIRPLVNTLQAAGEYSLTVSAGELSDGIYHCILSTPEAHLVRSFVIHR